MYVIAEQKSVDTSSGAAEVSASPVAQQAECSAPRAYVFGGGVLPTPLLGAILGRAALREVRHPGDRALEPRYRPSSAVDRLVRCRDLTLTRPSGLR